MQLSLAVVWVVALKKEYVSVGQRNVVAGILAFFSFDVHINPQVEYTREEGTQ